MSASRRYAVVHETKYTYAQPVGLSRQVAHLAPRTTPYQTCLSHVLAVTPEPTSRDTREDAFGNAITSMCIEEDHAELVLHAESHVTVIARDYPIAAQTEPWEAVRDRLAYQAGKKLAPDDLIATRYLFESTRVRNKRELATWTLTSFPSGAPLLAGAIALMTRIHREFAYDPRATTVSTPVMEVFAQRRGVCQDFAHLMLSCLRSIGLAARYVSGYLLTHPPAGKPRLVGADASHAWVSIHCPPYGWVDLDPTNGMLVGAEHVTLAWGRDYDDVIPVRGVLLGGGEHSIGIAVTVVPFEEYEKTFGTPPAMPSEK